MTSKVELVVEVDAEIDPIRVARFLRELAEEFEQRLLAAGVPDHADWQITDIYPKDHATS